MRAMRHFTLAAAIFGLALAAGGCTSLDLAERLTLPGAGPKPKAPTRMTDFWTDTVLHQPGLPGVRGFGGRLMFYNDEGGSPVPVEGTLTVFAYDETRGEASYSAPDKKYVFPADQWSKHYSKSEFGHSYSVWLPWDEVGGPRRTICLIARFEPKKGQMIVSRPCRKVLPGEPSPTERRVPLAAESEGVAATWTEQAQRPSGRVRQASHLEPVGPEAPARPDGAATITIDVPPSFARPGAADSGSGPSAGAGGRPEAGRIGSPSGKSPMPASREEGVSRESATPASGDSSASDQRPAPERFDRRRRLVQRAPIAPRVHDPVRREPLPAAWLSSLPTTPRSDWPGAAPARAGEPAPR